MSPSVFASRDFRLFYAGQAASYVGDGLRTIAVPLLVFKLTGSALNLGLSYGIEFFSFGLFSVIGGSLADRLNRKHLMIVCDVMRCLILATFALGDWQGWLTVPVIYVGLVVHAACGAIFNSGQASSIPYVLGKERATSAVAVLEGTFQSVNVIAPPVGAALFGLIGPLFALVTNALTYVVSLFSLQAIDDLGPEEYRPLPKLRELLADIGLGFRFLTSEPTLRFMSFTSFVAIGVAMIGWTVLVPFVERDLGGSSIQVGFAFAAMGLGSALGALLATRIQRPFGRLVIWAFLIDGLVWAPLAFTHSIVVTCASLFVSGMAGNFATSNILGWRMRVIPEGMVGRVFGAARVVVLGGTLPGALIGGAIAEHFGARIAVDVSIVAYLVVGLVLAASPTIRAESR